MQKSADVTDFVVASGDDVILYDISVVDDVDSVDDVVSCIVLLDVVVTTGREVTKAVVSCTLKKNLALFIWEITFVIS